VIITATVISACGGTTRTGTERNIDVGGGKGGSVGGNGAGAGGFRALGGATGAGGTSATGGASTDPCAGLRCANPNCPAGSVPVTQPGQCCPTGCEQTTSDAGVVPSTNADAGSIDGGGPIDCANSATCPSQWCEFQCCPGPGECAPCCVPKSCQSFDAAHCPLDGCQLMLTCAGTSVCYPFFTAPPPSCGELGYYGGHAPCCSDVVLRCGLPGLGGSCDLTVGGYNGFPMCIACGDGSCDTQYENPCNCPEDCH
jgi:hypothetical protein